MFFSYSFARMWLSSKYKLTTVLRDDSRILVLMKNIVELIIRFILREWRDLRDTNLISIMCRFWILTWLDSLFFLQIEEISYDLMIFVSIKMSHDNFVMTWNSFVKITYSFFVIRILIESFIHELEFILSFKSLHLILFSLFIM
jgi:hypothetical protein